MLNNPEIQPKTSASRHYLRVMAFAVVPILIGLALYFFYGGNENLAEPLENTATATTSEAVAFARSAPIELRIPKLGLITSFEPPLGLNEDQTIEVPDSYTKVGWYKHGATPGETGPSVILGHVDSFEGPAVFYHLGRLKKGDEIEVKREDGSVALFEVTSTERFDQDDFPTELVYGPTDGAEIRLITCTGVFSKGQQRYSHNLVVFGVLKSATSSETESI